jgi:hypothetical protein
VDIAVDLWRFELPCSDMDDDGTQKREGHGGGSSECDSGGCSKGDDCSSD